MSMPATTGKKYSVEEYFELEKTSPIRHEYVRGTLIPMTGESKKANKIATNCLRILADPLEEQGYEVYVHDVRLLVESGALYRYPDLVVVPETDKEDTHALTQPVLIIEVLSDTTAEKDRGAKLREYTALPTLQHYLLIAQDEMLVEIYNRKEGQWVLEFFDKSSVEVPIAAFDVSLPLKDIYRRTGIG